MSAQVLQLPTRHQVAAEMRHAARASLPAGRDPLEFANWLLAQVIAGRLSMEMAEEICRQQEHVA